jgi:hypothetical protein
MTCKKGGIISAQRIIDDGFVFFIAFVIFGFVDLRIVHLLFEINPMKRTLLSLVFAFLFLPSVVLAQCTVDVTPATDTICFGDSVTLTATVAGPSLLTTMNAGNNHRGNMFDLTAINTVTITSFDGSPMATTGIEIYYRVGTHVGFETSSAGWTLLGTAANVVPLGSPTPTPFPIPVNVTIPAGQTYSFYVTSTNTAVSLNYSNGTARGNVFASDANLQFKEGTGMEYPFTNNTSSFFQPRIWNGRIHYSSPGAGSYVWSNGATTSSITVAPAATSSYTVTATSGGTCTDNSEITVNNVTVNLGNDSAACGGLAVTLDAGHAGANYLWHTGATTQTISNTLGLNWVQATDTLGCMDRDSITLMAWPNPVVSLGPDEVSCGTASFTIDAGNSGAQYLWSTTDTTQQLTVSGAAIYSVDVTDSNGCMGSDTIFVSVGNPSVNLGNDTTLCNAAATTLNAGSGWASVLWNTGSTSNFLNVNNTAAYSVTVLDSAGCSAADTINVTASNAPVASFGVVGNSGCTIATVTNSSVAASGATWIWGDGNTSTGLNPGSHTYSQPFFGNITLIVNNPCGIDTLQLPFGCVGNSIAQAFELNIAPNPNHGKFNVRLNGLTTDGLELTVWTLQGQQVYQSRHNAQQGQFEAAIDLQGAAKGMYILKVEADGQLVTRMVVVE